MAFFKKIGTQVIKRVASKLDDAADAVPNTMLAKPKVSPLIKQKKSPASPFDSNKFDTSTEDLDKIMSGETTTTPTTVEQQMTKALPEKVDTRETIVEFYSPLTSAIENMSIAKGGSTGETIMAYLNKRAPNLSKSELKYSGLSLDPKKIYTKEEVLNEVTRNANNTEAKLIIGKEAGFKKIQRQNIVDKDLGYFEISLESKDLPTPLVAGYNTHHTPSTVAHSRSSIRKGKDEKYVFIEEIQSDPLQTINKKFEPEDGFDFDPDTVAEDFLFEMESNSNVSVDGMLVAFASNEIFKPKLTLDELKKYYKKQFKVEATGNSPRSVHLDAIRKSSEGDLVNTTFDEDLYEYIRYVEGEAEDFKLSMNDPETDVKLPFSKTTEYVKNILLSNIAHAKSLNINKIVIPNIKEITRLRATDFDEGVAAAEKALAPTYVDAIRKALNSLNAETNNKFLVTPREIKYPDLTEPLGYRTSVGTEIDITNFDFDPTTQSLRFADGGYLKARQKVGIETGKQTQAGRDVYKTPEGEMVSEKSTTIKYKNKWINIPSIHGGVQYDDDTLMLMLEAGKISPTSTHDTVEDAVNAARKRSESLEFNKGGTPMLGKQMELFSDGGLKDQGGSVDEVSGNDVPVGSLKKEVREDIPAKLSEGEFVLSADVVRFYGLSHIMAMRDKAKAGLAKMEAMGQMGNSTEATMEDDMPFSMEDLEVEDEEGNSLEYANGGFVRKFAEGGTPDPSIPPFSTPLPVPVAAPIGGYKPIFAGAPVEKKKLPTFAQVMPSPVTGQKQVKYVNAQGNVIDVWTDANGNPIYTVPEGYSPQATVPVAPSAPEVVAPTAPSVNKDGGGGGDKEKEAPAKKGTDWANITYKDLVEIGTEITSPAAKRAMGIFSAIPGIGLFAAAASTHQNSQLDKALVNQFLQPGLGGPEQDALSKIYTSNNSFLSRIFTDRPATLAEAAKGGVYKEPKVDKSVVAQAKEVSQGIATANLSASAVKLINTTATAAAEASTAAQVKRDGVAADYSPNGYSGTTVNNLVSTAGKISGVQQTGKVGILSGVVANDKDKDKNGNPTGTAARTTDTNRTVFSNADGSLYSKTGILGTKTVDVVKDPKTGQYKETGSDNNGGKEKADKSAVCTAFRNLGYLPDDIWALDDVFGKSLEKTNPTMVKGYRLWAVPVAKFIQTNTLPARTLRAIMWPITKAWAGEMAHKLKPENYKPNLSGKAIMFIGGSICSLIGYAHNMSCKQNGELV